MRTYRYLISYDFKSNYANGKGDIGITVNGKIDRKTLMEEIPQ